MSRWFFEVLCFFSIAQPDKFSRCSQPSCRAIEKVEVVRLTSFVHLSSWQLRCWSMSFCVDTLDGDREESCSSVVHMHSSYVSLEVVVCMCAGRCRIRFIHKRHRLLFRAKIRARSAQSRAGSVMSLPANMPSCLVLLFESSCF